MQLDLHVCQCVHSIQFVRYVQFCSGKLIYNLYIILLVTISNINPIKIKAFDQPGHYLYLHSQCTCNANCKCYILACVLQVFMAKAVEILWRHTQCTDDETAGAAYGALANFPAASFLVSHLPPEVSHNFLVILSLFW